MAICFWEATFGCKRYHLSDCYRLYNSCKNNIRNPLNYQIDLSDWYQLYIGCKINIETPITLSNRYETIRRIFFTTDDGYSCNHAEWVGQTNFRGGVVHHELALWIYKKTFFYAKINTCNDVYCHMQTEVLLVID